ncbi:MAG: hypothetical protein HY841_03740 [Bacteroidetes bacterium]|nr:hypothetical protein [Bacteroidota bacterium]
MQTIHQLIQRLSENEIELVRKYLTCFSSHNVEESAKTLKLFKYLLKQKAVPSASDCCIHVYGTLSKKDAFAMLKSRLKNKIADALNTFMNEETKEALDEVDYAAMVIDKKSAQYRQFFYSKPGLDITRNLLEETISLGKKYELYDKLITSLKFKKFRYTHKQGEEAYDALSSEIELYEKCNRASSKANDYYYRLIFMQSQKGKEDAAKIQKHLSGAIKELEKLYDQTKSNTVNYFLKNLELVNQLNNKDYLQARRVCLEFTQIIHSYPSVYRKLRIGIAYDYFSRCELYLGHYDSAAENAQLAQKQFSPESDNYSVAKAQEFFALFYAGKYNEAEAVAQSMLSISRNELGEWRYAQFTYLHACALFKLGKFEEVFSILSRQLEISKDKSGWELSLRVLRIMALIEMEQLKQASAEILSLKTFVMRLQKETSITKRDRKILAWLLNLEQNGYVFEKMNGQTEESLFLLSSDKPDYTLKLLTPELIPFHEWANSKMKPVGNLPSRSDDQLGESNGLKKGVKVLAKKIRHVSPYWN